MKLKLCIQTSVSKLFEERGIADNIDLDAFYIKPPGKAEFGDFKSNVVLTLGRYWQDNSSDFGELVVGKLRQEPGVQSVHLAENGFINITLSREFWLDVLSSIAHQGRQYGRTNFAQGKQTVVSFIWDLAEDVDFFSNLRVACCADAQANIMEFAGFNVVRKCYISGCIGSAPCLEELQRKLKLFGLNVDVYCFEELNGHNGQVGETLRYDNIVWCGAHSRKRITQGIENRLLPDIKVCKKVNYIGEGLKEKSKGQDLAGLWSGFEKADYDSIRFMMLYGRSDIVLDLNHDKVLDQSFNNPAFYVQYAHSQIFSVFRNTHEFILEVGVEGDISVDVDLQLIENKYDLRIISKLAEFSGLLEDTCVAIGPHRVAFYLYSLASDFHAILGQGKQVPQLLTINEDERELTVARVALFKTVATVLNSGLNIIGVKPIREMH